MPLLEEMRLAGATDYVMFPLPFLDRERSASLSFATTAPDGFSDAEIDALELADAPCQPLRRAARASQDRHRPARHLCRPSCRRAHLQRPDPARRRRYDRGGDPDVRPARLHGVVRQAASAPRHRDAERVVRLHRDGRSRLMAARS